MQKKGSLPAGQFRFSHVVLSALNEASDHSSGTANSSSSLPMLSSTTAIAVELFFSCLKLDHSVGLFL